jgi:hypothetical protein
MAFDRDNGCLAPSHPEHLYQVEMGNGNRVHHMNPVMACADSIVKQIFDFYQYIKYLIAIAWACDAQLVLLKKVPKKKKNATPQWLL